MYMYVATNEDVYNNNYVGKRGNIKCGHYMQYNTFSENVLFCFF